MNKSDLEKCQDEYERLLKENPLQSKIEMIAKTIREKQDKVAAMEFTRSITELLKENGIIVHCTYTKDLSDKSIESLCDVVFDSIDCTEHDKPFKTEIAQLKHDSEEMEKKVANLEFELSVKENLLKIKNGLCEESDLSGLTPIEVAEKLIYAESEYETNSIERALGAGEKRKYDIFSISELRQIAEHLLVYCNHNSEDSHI